MVATTFVVFRLPSVVRGCKQAYTVGMAVAEERVIDVSHITSTIMRTDLRAPTVADHQRFALAVGIGTHIFYGIVQIRRIQAIDTSKVELCAGCHASVCGVGMVVGHSRRGAADFDARTARCRCSVRAVVLGVVVGQGAGDLATIIGRGFTSIIDVSLLDAAVAAGILEGNMVEVDARVNDAEHDARAVVFLLQSGRDGISSERQGVVGIGYLPGRIGESPLQG